MRTLLLATALLISTAVDAGSFARHHPDQYFFKRGMDAYLDGKPHAAATDFRRAARYADKTSQLALAFLFRDGKVTGTPDHAQAYAWADLAAERGYPDFLVVREKIWAALDEATRARALAVGETLYAEYGDAIAKPRLERELRRGLASKTGSRSGSNTARPSVTDLSDAAARAAFVATFLSEVTRPGVQPINAFVHAVASADDAGVNVFAGDYYADENWRPAAYWRARDADWIEGIVTVKPLRSASGE